MEFIKAAISKTEIGIGFAFPCPVTNFLGNDEVFIGVLYYSLEFIKSAISKTELGIGFALPCPIINFLGNDEVFISVLY